MSECSVANIDSLWEVETINKKWIFVQLGFSMKMTHLSPVEYGFIWS
jgi:hypothetical protein